LIAEHPQRSRRRRPDAGRHRAEKGRFEYSSTVMI